MTKLEMVFVASKLNVYGQEEYAVLERGTNYMCRGELHNRQQAYEIAARIDASLVYERDNGAGSLDVF